MENQTNLKAIIIKYGVLLGLITITIQIVKHFSGNTYNSSDYLSSTLNFVALISLIVLGFKKFKSENDGYLRWGQGVKIGMGIAIISGILGIIYQYVFMTFIEPEFIKNSIELAAVELEKSGLNEDQIETALAQVTKMMTPVFIFGLSILGTVVGGFIISAIISAIMKNDDRNSY